MNYRRHIENMELRARALGCVPTRSVPPAHVAGMLRHRSRAANFARHPVLLNPKALSGQIWGLSTPLVHGHALLRLAGKVIA